MEKEEFIVLCVRYFSKETTLEENKQIKRLLKKNTYQSIFNELSEKWAQNIPDEVTFDFNEGLEDLYGKITKYDPNFSWYDKKIKGSHYVNIYKGVASIVFVILVSLTLLYLGGMFDKPHQIAEMNEKTTKSGQKSIITLFDGTKITLNANSKLKYPSYFGETSREVFLTGEAYFEVVHDTTKPFIVHTDKVSTTVLGTKFNISAFAEDKEVKVSLVEGKVLVSSKVKNAKSNSFYLKPKQQFIFDKTNNKRRIREFNILQEVGWKDNRFVFKNTLLNEVFKVLGRTFGVKFSIRNSRSNIKLTANFNNASFWTIVKTIKSVTKLDYNIEYNKNEIMGIEFYSKK